MIDVTVSSRNDEALDICSYELVQSSGEPLPPFTAGAHIDVHLPDGLIRQYSLCNPPHERHRYLIGVLNDPASRGGSRRLHQQIHPGAQLRISEPRNLFPLAQSARRSLLFAGGIGITPILCMAEQLAQDHADFELHYCVRSAERGAFIQRLQQSAFADRVTLHLDEQPETALNALHVLAAPAPDTHLYVCGPGGFMQHILDTARTAGWSEDHLHREYFAAEPIDTRADGSFSIEIASTGQVIAIPANKTVAQVLESQGIDIPLSCEQGVCGTCLTRVLKGVPDHRDLFLTEEEQALNDQFTPCCSRSKTPLLVLDI
ncbi:PDR/VanB family oxidoreductase [Pseudomonas syringae]|uniref:2Fe-2S iron-sulfur cluster binding domain-containing protein n=1 Tax=Pseudomonas syringae TaxID=317 RepID=A0A9Q4A1X0_PSESX|nr:PDR/VanB family oxidoreductase [Pseudomonas syringae]MCF5466429.1 2Fe-2S iron-sulfur cluster binding domain-containing protein [Pseudomonas syringae]MCF5471478.1 2Fe-2S iron-sulfur cluster binding domain-containing protein [Pseudomonas syringae]MCF5482227.1 2Fe-2S iron-sulfur cluster binding domain-containing protein [Pseudomonas syringae]MCF5486109.1 2Fe-2S iron-sulfur cluster binding domain-containing protein [Pseudomonas syringae]MCF5494531.1 2Fe-2S iron-sulfur cluster binding domain-con